MVAVHTKYLLLEILPQAHICVATLCEHDQSTVAEFASECCPTCAMVGCMDAAFDDGLLADGEQVEIRLIDPNAEG